MTDKEQNDIPQEAQPVDQSEGGQVQSKLAEIPDLLAKISQRIAENQGVDQARTKDSSLDEMRDRLDELKQQASDAQDQLHNDDDDNERTPFASVEAALAKLSEDVDDAERAATSKPKETSSVTEPAAEKTETASKAKPKSRSRAKTKSKPRAIRSKAKPRSNAATVETDSTTASATDTSWNEEAAEQLTKQCEDAGLATGRSSDDLLIGAESSPATAEPVSYVYLQPDSREIGQQWFEQRFEELATRFDRATSDTAQEDSSSIATLEAKFDSLEARLNTLLGYAPEDGEAAVGGSLNDIELCIAEIANQLESTTTELARIEGIEGRLSEISEVLASQNNAPHQDSALDVAAIADLVADRVAAKPMAFASGGASMEPGDKAGISELSAAMKEFMRDRRNEGEHANAVLDTMQQTIIRVLDRMEALETNAPRQGASSGGSAAVNNIAAAPASEKSAEPKQVKPSQPSAPRQPDRAPTVAAEPAAASKTKIEKARPAPAELSADSAEATVSLNRLQMAVGKLQSTEPAPGQSTGNTEAPSVAPRSRADFMATARKVAVSAGNQTAANADRLANDDEIDLDEIDLTEEDLAHGNVGAHKLAANRNSSRVRLLVAAIALIAVGLGATKFMMSRSGEAALQQLQSNQMQQGTNQSVDQKVKTRAAARRVGDVTPAETQSGGYIHNSSADASVQSVQPGKVVYRAGDGTLVQPAALSPEQANLTENGQPISGGANSSSRKNLPSALVGPLSLRLAAANGDASAEFQVAARFAEGKGVRQDFNAAHKWYRRSAGRGFALSQYRLGTLYERGLGVEKDTARARVWYQRAAQQDNIKAMHNLAVLAASSAAGKPDYTTAARWFTEAAERGLGDSQFNLAILYQNGLGVEMDEAVAYKWFSLAASSGDAEALKRQLELAVKLGKERVAKIDREVQGWLRKPSNKLTNDPHYAGQAWQRS